PLAARVQEPDDARDAARRLHPGRDPRPGGPVRRQGVRTRSATARHPRGGKRAFRRPGRGCGRGAGHAGESRSRARGPLSCPPHAGAPLSGDGGRAAARSRHAASGDPAARGRPANGRGVGRRRRRGRRREGRPAMMRLPPFRFLAARTAREAAAVLADHGPDAMAVAGGTDLYPNMKRRQMTPKVLVGLRSLPDADAIATNGGLRLGALATLTAVAEHVELAVRWPSLPRAPSLVPSPPPRHAGPIGGKLGGDTRCNYYNQSEFWRASVGYCMKRDGDVCLVAPGSDKCWALSSSDTAPVMIALGAEVTLVGASDSRRVPVRDFYGPDGIDYLAKKPDEILTEIHVPDPAGC